MQGRFAPVVLIAIILASVFAITGATWLNYQVVEKYPGSTDFLPAWVGTRSFLQTGISPYSAETTASIQQLTQQYPDSIHSAPAQFLFPLYSIILFAPFALIEEFNLALSAWMTLLEVTIVLSLSAALRLSRWQVHKIILGIVLIFSLIWYPSVKPLFDGNPTILCLLFIVGAFWAIEQEQDALAGILFALASIKPQMILLLLVFVFVWAISTRRWLILWATLGSLFILIAATSILIPNWMMQYITEVIRVLGQAKYGTPRLYFLHWLPGVGNQLGWLLTILVALALIWEWRLALKKEFRWFLWTAYLTIVATTLSGIPTTVENYIVFLAGFILVLALWDSRWGILGKGMIVTSLILLSGGLWWLAYRGYNQGIPPELSFGLFLFLPMFMGAVLYWVRWWAIRPTRLFLEKINQEYNR